MAEIENLKIGANGTIHIVGNENIITEEWEASKSYVKDKSYVIREHKLYVCNVTHTSTSSFDPMKWTEITVIGAIDNALDMTDTASGAIATFESEYALPLRDCTIEINAVQESGTPTPSSPKLISGFMGANIKVAGANLWDEEWELGGISGTDGTNSPANDRIRSKNYISITPNTSIYDCVTTSYSTCTIYICEYDYNKTFIQRTGVGGNITFTTTANTFYIRFFIYAAPSVTTYNNDISLNYPATDTAYHAYNANSTTAITWQSEAGTVYGGSLDVTSGKLTVTHARVDLGSLTQWNKNTSFTNTLFVANITGKKANNSNCLCTNYVNGGIATGGAFLNNMQNNNFASDTSNGIYIRDDSKASLSGDDFKTAMSGVYLVYELATPVTYQLTPTQISAIVGTNNVFTDTNGDTSLEYYTKRGEQTVRIAEGVAVDVINNKNIDTLTTTNKTLVGAVNEVNGKVNAIGTIVNGSSTGGSAVFTRTWSAKASITLTKGVWIINTRVLLQQDNNGYRALNIATTSGDSTPQCTSPAVNGNLTALNMSVMQNVTSSRATFYLNGVHNSTQNSELSMISWYLNAVRIA